MFWSPKFDGGAVFDIGVYPLYFVLSLFLVFQNHIQGQIYF